MVSKMVLDRKLIVFAIVALGGLFGAINSLYVNDDVFYGAVIFESLITSFLFLCWFIADAIRLGKSPSALFAVLIFLFYPVVLPIYLFLSRNLIKGLFHIAVFLVVMALYFGFYEGSYYLAEHLKAINENRAIVLNADSSNFNNSKMKKVVNYYQKIINDNATPYIVVDSNLKDVIVPGQYADEKGYVVLDISPGALRDLEITDSKIKFSATFEGAEMNVVATRESILAIYYMETGEGITF